MKGVFVRFIIVSAILASFLFLLSNCGSNSESGKSVTLENKKDSISYVIGTDMARSLIQIKDEIDLDKLVGGIKDQLDEKPLLVKKEDAQTMMREFSMQMRKKQMEANKASASNNQEKGMKFLEENKQKQGVVTTQSGLQYFVLQQGNGPKPTRNDKVKVHYKGTPIDGTQFDSSYDRGQPASFQVTGVIKGWTEALLLMNVGSKYKLFIPSELAYGQRGAGQKIGPNEVLIFEVELLGIE
jgi:FKBP-type peptidyl-prolyl cis-trans isomerase